MLSNIPKCMPHADASSCHLQMLTSEDMVRCQTSVSAVMPGDPSILEVCEYKSPAWPALPLELE